MTERDEREWALGELCGNKYLRGAICTDCSGYRAGSSLAIATSCRYYNCPFTGEERARENYEAYESSKRYQTEFRGGFLFFTGTNQRVPLDWDGTTGPKDSL